MAWYPQFRHEWKSDNDDTLIVDFERDVYYYAPIIVKAQPSPFVIDYPKLKDKFEPVRGNGAEINLISETDGQLLDLIGNDPKEWKVKYYKNGTLEWMGWLVREQFEEPFSESENYPVSLHAANGFALLDEIAYLKSDGSKYTGLATQWDIITEIFTNHWGLIDDVYAVLAGLNTKFEGVEFAAGETILHKTYVKQANYYDEDDPSNPMSCREVLDSILRPYGAYIIQSGIYLYILDVHITAGGGSAYEGLYDNTFTYQADVGIPPLIDIYDDRGVYKTGGTVKTTLPFNYFKFRYSKYKAPELTTHLTDASLLGTGSTFPAYPDTSFYYQPIGTGFYFREYYSSSEWHFDGTGVQGSADIPAGRIMQFKQKIDDEPEQLLNMRNPDYYIWYGSGDSGSAEVSWSDSYVIGNDTTYLKIDAEIKFNNVTNPYDTEPAEALPYIGEVVAAASIDAFIMVGSMSYNRIAGEWAPTIDLTTSERSVKLFAYDESDNVMEQWLPIRTINGSGSVYSSLPNTEESVLIRLQEGVTGNVTMSVQATQQGYHWNEVVKSWTSPQSKTQLLDNAYLRDITIDFVQVGTLSEQTDDPEYFYRFDDSGLTNKTKSITLNHGDSSNETPVDNGALIYSDEHGVKHHIASWSRGGITGSVEELLLDSYINNYSASSIEYDIEIDNPLSLPSLRMTDEYSRSGTIFMYGGGTINPTEQSEKVHLIEVKKDE